jgi:hypothetical protein
MRHDCTREIEAATAPLLAALRMIAKHGYGLQGIQEDHGHDANAYNYRAMGYFSAELFRKEQIAREAIAGNAPKMPRRRVVLAGDGDLGNSAPLTTPEREAASAARIWPSIDGGVE